MQAPARVVRHKFWAVALLQVGLLIVWGSEGRCDPAPMEVMALSLPSMSLSLGAALSLGRNSV